MRPILIKYNPILVNKNFHFSYMEIDSFFLSMKTKNIVENLIKLEDVIDFSNLDGKPQFFSNKNKKVSGKYKIELLKVFGEMNFFV